MESDMMRNENIRRELDEYAINNRIEQFQVA